MSFVHSFALISSVSLSFLNFFRSREGERYGKQATVSSRVYSSLFQNFSFEQITLSRSWKLVFGAFAPFTILKKCNKQFPELTFIGPGTVIPGFQ